MNLFKEKSKILGWFLFTILLLVSPLKLKAQQDTSVTSIKIKFTTSTPNGKYSPKNIGVVWIEDSTGKFVKTLKRWADKRKKHLYTWKAVSGENLVDAATGATERTHKTHEVTWNLTDLNRNRVPDATYTVRFELTDKNNQGPVSSFDYNLGSSADTVSIANKTNFKNISVRTVISNPTDISDLETQLPHGYQLEQNFPNPFNPTTTIVFSVPSANPVVLKLYDSSGREVETLFEGQASKGKHSIEFDASNYSSGIYYYRFTGFGFSDTKKCMILK
jgi:flagellar hook assembly protein FlgD